MALRLLPAVILALLSVHASAQSPADNLPSLLTVPEPVPEPVPAASIGLPRPTCPPSNIDYQPGHVYLPAGNPDYRSRHGRHTGDCGDECDRCRQWWLSGSFLFAQTRDLSVVDREHTFGFQIAGGYWFDESRTAGISAAFTNVHDPFRTILSGVSTDAPLTVNTGEGSLSFELMRGEWVRFDGLVGYRYMQLHEKALTSDGTFFLDRTDWNVAHCGQIGLIGTCLVGSYFAEATTKLALGRNEQTRRLNGIQTSSSELSLIPDLGLRLGYQLGDGAWLTIGYEFLLLTNAARPAIPDSQSFFIHAAIVGLELRF